MNTNCIYSLLLEGSIGSVYLANQNTSTERYASMGRNDEVRFSNIGDLIRALMQIVNLLTALSNSGWSLDQLRQLTENKLARADAQYALDNWAARRVRNVLYALARFTEVNVSPWFSGEAPKPVTDHEYAKAQAAFDSSCSGVHVSPPIQKHKLDGDDFRATIHDYSIVLIRIGSEKNVLRVFARLDRNEKVKAADAYRFTPAVKGVHGDTYEYISSVEDVTLRQFADYVKNLVSPD